MSISDQRAIELGRSFIERGTEMSLRRLFDIYKIDDGNGLNNIERGFLVGALEAGWRPPAEVIDEVLNSSG